MKEKRFRIWNPIPNFLWLFRIFSFAYACGETDIKTTMTARSMNKRNGRKLMIRYATPIQFCSLEYAVKTLTAANTIAALMKMIRKYTASIIFLSILSSSYNPGPETDTG